MFKEDINPTDSIVNLLKGIDERNPDYNKYIFIGRKDNGITKFKVMYKDPNENRELGSGSWVTIKPRMEKSVPLYAILRDSVTCLDKLT